jgi:hypothetical protein
MVKSKKSDAINVKQSNKQIVNVILNTIRPRRKKKGKKTKKKTKKKPLRVPKKTNRPIGDTFNKYVYNYAKYMGYKQKDIRAEKLKEFRSDFMALPADKRVQVLEGLRNATVPTISLGLPAPIRGSLDGLDREGRIAFLSKELLRLEDKTQKTKKLKKKPLPTLPAPPVQLTPKQMLKAGLPIKSGIAKLLKPVSPRRPPPPPRKRKKEPDVVDVTDDVGMGMTPAQRTRFKAIKQRMKELREEIANAEIWSDPEHPLYYLYIIPTRQLAALKERLVDYPTDDEDDADDARFHSTGMGRLLKHIQKVKSDNMTTGGLYGSQLDTIMKGTPHWKGIVSSDQLNHLKPSTDMNFIVNHDTSDGGGTHWVACRIDSKSKTVEYCDSFGKVPIPLIDSGLKDMFGNIDPEPDSMYKYKYSTKSRQDTTSDTCGYFACLFLLSRNNGQSFVEATGYDESDVKDKANAGIFKFI